MRQLLLAAAAALLAPAALAAAPAAPVTVTAAWVRLPAVPGRPAAAYFTLTGGAVAARLTGVASPAAKRAEMHRSATADGIASMAAVAEVAIPPRAIVRFASGGYHVMLFGLDSKLRPGQPVPLTLRFAGGGTTTVAAKAVAAGGDDGMAGMHGMHDGH